MGKSKRKKEIRRQEHKRNNKRIAIGCRLVLGSDVRGPGADEMVVEERFGAKTEKVGTPKTGRGFSVLAAMRGRLNRDRDGTL